MPQFQTAEHAAATAAQPARVGQLQLAPLSAAASTESRAAQTRCPSCGGVSPLFLSACVDCGEPLQALAPEFGLRALTRHVTVASLLLLVLGAGLVWLLG
jgi:hypothetical protein